MQVRQAPRLCQVPRSTVRKRSSSLELLYAVRNARPQSPSLSSSDFPAAELRSLKAKRADCWKVTPVAFAEPPPLPSEKGASFRRLFVYCFVSGLGLQDQRDKFEFTHEA